MTSNYQKIESQRWHNARVHDLAMEAKYGALHGRENTCNNYDYWFDESGTEVHFDFPKPYSWLYFRRFLELFFTKGSEENIYYHLASEFIGDEVDAQYIESLFLKAETHSMFEPGGILEFRGAAFSHFEPLLKGHKRVPLRWPLAEPAPGQRFYGSKANRGRRRLIRSWLKKRAKELATTSSGEKSTISHADAFSQLFALRFTLTHCDALMAKVLVGPAYKKPTNLSAKIWALLDVIAEKKLLICTAVEAAQIAGDYYSYPMAAKPSKTKDGEPYKKAYAAIHKAVKEAISGKEYGPNYSPITP